MIKLISAANLTQIADINLCQQALSRKFNVSFHILCRKPFSKTRQTALQKAVFRTLKGHLLQGKTRHIGKPLNYSHLQSRHDLRPETASQPVPQHKNADTQESRENGRKNTVPHLFSSIFATIFMF